MSRDAFGDMAKRGLGQCGKRMPVHRGFAKNLDPDFSGAVGADLDDFGIIKPGPERGKRGFEKDGLGG